MLHKDTELQLWYSNGLSYRYKERPVLGEMSGTSLELPTWWASAIQRIAFLLDLDDDWDSYGAKKIDRTIAYHSVQILQQITIPNLPAPSIVPTARGFLQFEWHIYGIDLEFEVISPTYIDVAYEDSQTGIEWDRHLDYNLTPLSEVLEALASRNEVDKAA